jgi:hypothetical protein
MRLTVSLIVVVILAACALQQTGGERSLIFGGSARDAQAALDAEVIMQGMAQARSASQRLARATHDNGSDPRALTR